jgi:uncharacterized spore protein YtfJ
MNNKINLKIKKIIIKNSGDLKMVEVEPIKTTVEELRKLVNIQNFIGEPIEVEDKVIIPVSKVGVAFGVGENKSEKVLGGAAGGAGIEPVSMVVITKGVSGIEGIRNINLTEGNEVNKAISDLGLIIGDLIKTFVGSRGGMESPAEEETIINVDDIQNGEYSKEAKETAEEVQEAAEEVKSIIIEDDE